MKRTLLLSAGLLCLCSCATLQPGESLMPKRYFVAGTLVDAREFLAAGDRAAAAKKLAAVIDAGSYPDITDEALFRLALLSLRQSTDHDATLQSMQLLKRLKKEFPDSVWTVQSGQLLDVLTGLEELRRQNRTLKNSNQSLNTEINELNRNINQLKKLDLQLEKKRR